MARYILQAKSLGGLVESNEPLTLQQALTKAAEMRDAHFDHITIINIETGLAITDLEQILSGTEGT